MLALEAVQKQIELEIATDLHAIEELLQNPVSGETPGVAYGISRKFEHLGSQKVALIEVERMIGNMQSAE